jgi:hypothetical protein
MILETCRLLAPGISEAAVKYIVGSALEQVGTAFVRKVIAAARYRSARDGRKKIGFEDIEKAVAEDILHQQVLFEAHCCGRVQLERVVLSRMR